MISWKPLSALALCLAVLCGTSLLMAGKDGKGKPPKDDPPTEPPVDPPPAPFSYEVRTIAFSDPDDPSVLLDSEVKGMNNHGDIGIVSHRLFQHQS